MVSKQEFVLIECILGLFLFDVFFQLHLWGWISLPYIAVFAFIFGSISIPLIKWRLDLKEEDKPGPNRKYGYLIFLLLVILLLTSYFNCAYYDQTNQFINSCPSTNYDSYNGTLTEYEGDKVRVKGVIESINSTNESTLVMIHVECNASKRLAYLLIDLHYLNLTLVIQLLFMVIFMEKENFRGQKNTIL
jgi:hypothetical protein